VFTAVVRVSGAGRLADFRERLRWLMVRDADAEHYTEHHGEGVLEYRFQPKKGIPFPAFAEASGDFPELRVEARWERDGVRGSALIENGQVAMEDQAAPDTPDIEVTVGDDGKLLLGFISTRKTHFRIGYAVTADRHTCFRYQDGELALLDADSPDADLEEIAFRLVDEWIWFDEEDAALERARYAGYGYPVRGANLKSEKLALLRRQEGGRYSTLGSEARELREALVSEWLKTS
jgi:hypothetical protein